LLLRISTVRMTLAGFGDKRPSSPNEKRWKADKKSVRSGKVTLAGQAAWKTSEARRCYKRHRWTVRKSNLWVKRRDPWRRANAPPKAVADPEPVVKTRKESQACLDLVCRPVAQPPVEASWKASL